MNLSATFFFKKKKSSGKKPEAGKMSQLVGGQRHVHHKNSRTPLEMAALKKKKPKKSVLEDLIDVDVAVKVESALAVAAEENTAASLTSLLQVRTCAHRSNQSSLLTFKCDMSSKCKLSMGCKAATWFPAPPRPWWRLLHPRLGSRARRKLLPRRKRPAA